jgi:hypothetical protein
VSEPDEQKIPEHTQRAAESLVIVPAAMLPTFDAVPKGANIGGWVLASGAPRRSARLLAALWILPLCLGFWIVLGWHNQRLEWDRKLTSVAAQIRPGASKPQLRALLEDYQREVPAAFIVSKDGVSWYVMNPPELGAQERILTLEFDQQGRLVHRRLRTSDTETKLPPGAPPDF